MARDEQVNIRLTENRKRRWKHAAEERERPLTQFIRWCVEQEISGTSNPTTNISFDEGKLDTIIEEIHSLDSSITGGPGSLSHRLQAIEGQLADDPQARELATTVYGLLPDEDQLTTLPDFDDPSARVGENGRVVTGDPEHIAQYIRYSPDLDGSPDSREVQRALDDLQQELHNIQRHPDGRYYRA